MGMVDQKYVDIVGTWWLMTSSGTALLHSLYPIHRGLSSSHDANPYKPTSMLEAEDFEHLLCLADIESDQHHITHCYAFLPDA